MASLSAKGPSVTSSEEVEILACHQAFAVEALYLDSISIQ